MSRSREFCARCEQAVCTDWEKTKLRDPRLRTRIRWPEGPVCVKCYDDAVHTRGRCDGCDVDRLLPGIGPAGARLCTSCAGGLGDFTCRRCGQEGPRYRAGECARCVLSERLAACLDDGTGAIRPELRPFYESFRAMPRARGGLLWLSKPHIPPLLSALAGGAVPLTHAGLSTLQPWRAVIHLRDLLVDAGVLPPVDRFLFLLEQWLHGWLSSIEDPQHRSMLERFATWHVLRQLRNTAARQPINPGRANLARHVLRTSAQFLVHLAEHNRPLEDCGQADIDRWFAADLGRAEHSRAFLRWCIAQRELPRLRIPSVVKKTGARLSQPQRLAFIRRVLTDPSIPAADRVLALLILLYAQPLVKVARLTVDDVLREQDQVLLRLGDPPIPVPLPFADVLLDYVANRPNMFSATNPSSRLLFPGRRAGQPMHTTSLRLRLRNLGLPSIDARTATIRQLLLEAPAAVVAGMLGYHVGTAETLAIQAGSTWARYAAGDHQRPPQPQGAR
ncbi:hypothetical protein [Amycolatopsis sp. RTGN1]|uniref:hypothetical protein n=1 Tax=Amycolatopsis ponsaeliensis TaxID=2992142 RepID=UPI002549E576|nr:hypothetical protein [Amycolatopsis sp. RTGN1]